MQDGRGEHAAEADGGTAPVLHVVLVEPDIAPNTGAIARLCAATDVALHLVEPLGFRLTDRHMRRAGLDYWPFVRLHRHRNWDALREHLPGRLHLYSTRGEQAHTTAHYARGDGLVFGSESRGLPAALLLTAGLSVYRIPMRPGAVRSLNVATAAGIVLYEALRQVRPDYW